MSKVYEILSYGHPILREECSDVEIQSNIDDIVSNMVYTMQHAPSQGLAAPQIGESLNIFLIDISWVKDHPSENKEYEIYKEVFINPKIVKEYGDDTKITEGCLSIPGVSIDVTRKSVLDIEYYDRNWNFKKLTADGRLARVIQHEYDHLKGILHIDYASSLKKKLIQKKLNQIKHGKIYVDYKMKFNI